MAPARATVGDDRSLSGQVAAGGAWGLGGQLAVLLATVLATPFTIRLLGPSRYGAWGLLQAALPWAALADLGMAGTVRTKFAAERYTDGDDPAKRPCVWTTLGVTVSATACAAALIGVLAPSIVLHLVHAHVEFPWCLRRRTKGLLRPIRVPIGGRHYQRAGGSMRLRRRPYRPAITQGGSLVLIIGVPACARLPFGGRDHCHGGRPRRLGYGSRSQPSGCDRAPGLSCAGFGSTRTSCDRCCVTAVR